MDENQEGTPNPLNPSNDDGFTPIEHEATEPERLSSNPGLDANPAESTVVDPMIKTGPARESRPTSRKIDVTSTTVEEVVDELEETPTMEETIEEIVTPLSEPAIPAVNPTGQTVDPMNRPMEKAPEIETTKPKKKKTGLIIGLIISLIIAIGCGVAAAILLLQEKSDPVTAAVEKIISGQAPENIAFDGTINIKTNDTSSQLASIEISLNGQGITNSLINTSTVSLTASFKNGGSISLGVSETYAAEGNLFLKIDGIKNITEDPYLLESISGTSSLEITDTEITNCENGDENCLEVEASETELVQPGVSNEIASLIGFLTVLESIDGEWLMIPLNDLSEISNGVQIDENANCLFSIASDLRSNSNSVSGLYRQNPFIISSTENITINSEKNPVYQITINNEKFANFADALEEANIANGFSECLGGQVTDFSKWPAFFVEIDENNNFTRFYTHLLSENGAAEATIDFNLSYPNNVNVPEPEEYRNFNEALQEIFQKTFETQ